MDKCSHCNLSHPGVCGRVKYIEYDENGTIRKVEFYPPGDIVYVPTLPIPPSPWIPYMSPVTYGVLHG